eukprot:TRINITY_DN70580_c0_g1_i2.p1 TRINITY_DN70580_c0_g1~~TRINITY_DN70580_c0_g1_i2.p1  ORF type:complete len:321 (-),score=47.18 TRINITY_DN70580_c0_g1_i2:482-1444(-)
MPWWAYLQLDWTQLYKQKLKKLGKMPWEERKPHLFWRGSDTSCLLPDSCQSAENCRCSEWNRNTWARFPRSRLVLASTFVPDRIDAKFTKNIVHEDCAETFEAADLWIDEIVAPDDHVIFKYLMYIDGVSFSDRLYWLMQTNSVVFRAKSQLRVWLDGALVPGEHYIAVEENMTDLVDKLDWARANDDAARRIASKGALMAGDQLSLEGALHYLYRLLMRVAAATRGGEGGTIPTAPLTTQRTTQTVQKAPEAGDEESLELGDSLECWAQGFTPEFCCDIVAFGDEGNVVCWDMTYSFKRCCVGRLAERSFWQAHHDGSS